MRWLKKLLLKIIKDDVYQIGPVDTKIMEDWLRFSFRDNGFKHYYTMRKKSLASLLMLGIEGKEQYETLGRLKELKQLSTAINSAQIKALDKVGKKIALEKKK